MSCTSTCENCNCQDDTETQDFGAGTDWVFDNHNMHTKFGVREAVDKLTPAQLLSFLEFRLKFLEEELSEARDAYELLKTLRVQSPEAVAAYDKSELGAKCADDIVDAMVDLCVVAIGTLDALRVDAYEAWDRVHIANMKKEVGIKPSRPNPLGLPDLVKPTGWQAPSHLDNLGILPRLYDNA